MELTKETNKIEIFFNEIILVIKRWDEWGWKCNVQTLLYGECGLRKRKMKKVKMSKDKLVKADRKLL